MNFGSKVFKTEHLIKPYAIIVVKEAEGTHLMSRSKINILMILLDRTFPPNIRVEKEASTLESNYNIFLLTRLGTKQQHYDLFKGIHIFRLDWPVNIRILRYLIDRLLTSLKILPLVLRYDIRILHVHDLPYALLVTILGKIYRRKVVFDMHEHYVGMIEEGLKEETSARSQLGKLWLFYMRLSELLACKLATKVIVVVEENAERLVGLGIPKNKMAIVSNTADIEHLKSFEGKSHGKLSENKFIVSYVGGLDLHRGLETLIKALPITIKKFHNIHLLLVGGKPYTRRKSLENLCRQLNVEEHVTFTGWVPYKKAMECMRASDLSVIPYQSTPLTNATIPNKIFESMYFKKPVLVSDVKPLKRVVEETRCGFIFQAGDHVQLADKIMRLIDNPELMKEMGKRGRKAVKNKYNWNVDGAKLLQLYSELE